MKKSMKALSVFLAIAMLLSLFAACGGGTEQETAAPDEDIQAPAAETTPDKTGQAEGTPEKASMYPISDEPVTLSMWYVVSPDVLSNIDTVYNHQGMIAAAEKTGVNLEVVEVAIPQARETFGIMAASNEYCDMIKANVSYYNTNGLTGALAEDLIIDLTDYMETYAPDYWGIISGDEEARRDAITDNGEVLAFYIINGNRLAANGLTIRYDLLEELEMDIPETYEEYYDVLTAFKSEYDMTDPLFYNYANPVGGGVNSDLAAYLIGGYNVNWAFYNEEGTIKYGPMEDGFYDFISMLSKWYSEGLINADFHTRPTNNLDPINQNIFLSGNQGIAVLTDTDLTTMPLTNTTENPNYRLVAIKDPSIDGQGHHMGGDPSFFWSGGQVTTVTSACENPELAVMWQNFWYTEEGSLIASYGIEGVSYEYDSEGKPVFTELVSANPDGMAYSVARQVYCLFTIMPCLYDMQNVYSFFNEDSKAASDIWTSNVDNDWIIPATLTFTAEESDAMSSVKPDIETLNLETLLAFIVGEKPLNEETWGAYQDTLIDLDIQGCIDIYQQAINRYLAR